MSFNKRDYYPDSGLLMEVLVSVDEFFSFVPVDIRFYSVPQAFLEIEQRCEGKKVLFLATDSAVERAGLENVLQRVAKKTTVTRIHKIAPNPTVSDVTERLSDLADTDIDLIISLGGGSCIDLAKVLSLFKNNVKAEDISFQTIRNLIKNKDYEHFTDSIDHITIPTTAGTGSEMTKWATVWNPEKKEKLSVDNTLCFPKEAIVVPELTYTMSENLTLATGLDALCHACEAFWSNKRTPVCQELALHGIQLIAKALPRVLENPTDVNGRKEMLLGSLFAGMAFSQTRTTACHSISYPLTMLFGMEHGFAAASTLVSIMRVNKEVVAEVEKIEKVFDAFGGLEKWIFDITTKNQLKLSSWGVKKEDIEKITELSFTQGRMDNNPFPLDKEKVSEVLEKCL